MLCLFETRLTQWITGEIKGEAADAKQVLTQRVKRAQAKRFCEGVVSIVTGNEIKNRGGQNLSWITSHQPGKDIIEACVEEPAAAIGEHDHAKLLMSPSRDNLWRPVQVGHGRQFTAAAYRGDQLNER